MALATVFSYILIEFTSLFSLCLGWNLAPVLEVFFRSFIWSEGPLWVDNWLTALMGRAEQISQLNEAMEGKGAQFMLILNLLFCCSKEAAEGNQMTMIVGKSERRMQSADMLEQTLCNATNWKKRTFGRQQFINTFYTKERRNTVVEQWFSDISDRMLYFLLHCMHQTAIVNSYITDFSFLPHQSSLNPPNLSLEGSETVGWEQ